jgi:DNA-binding response OmpR family regulator
MTHILAVDDESNVLKSISRVLQAAGFTVTTASSGLEALELIRHQRPDLVVLDIIMPDMDGLEVCRRLRADPFLARLPIIFLTARGRPTDIVEGLDIGADEFLVKPFEVVELPARIRALLRRAPGGILDPQADSIHVGNLKLMLTRTEASLDGREINLTAVEHRLLHCLMLHAGQPVPVDQLLQDVWEYPPGVGDPKLVHVHVGKLRGKVEEDTNNPRTILNIRGQDYLIPT